MAKTIETESSPVNIITAGTKIKGDITATGDFRLDGTLEGNIQLNGKLVVGDSGVVKGNIMCQNANIIGMVDGNISVKELLALHATARITGDILINKLSIEPGAVFTGRCRMLDEVRAKQESETTASSDSKE